LRLFVLGSGSAGNAAYVEAGSTRVLVDAGPARAEIEARLARTGLRAESKLGRLAQLDGLIITHEHNDHVGSAASIDVPRYATLGTQRAADLTTGDITPGRAFSLGAFVVEPVALPHDAAEPIGVILEADGVRAGILTDCGHPAEEVAAAYAGCSVLVLETNHEPSLLRRGPYPPSVARRIGGDRGHLSNRQAVALLEEIGRRGDLPRVIIAAHLSRANNDPLLVERLLRRAAPRSRILIADSDGALAVTATRERITIEPPRRSQMFFAFAEPEC
jgi:phosphoribosyl 1,2-cyclic phosphodiesterase